MKRKKIFTNHVSDKGLVSELYMNTYTSTIKAFVELVDKIQHPFMIKS